MNKGGLNGYSKGARSVDRRESTYHFHLPLLMYYKEQIVCKGLKEPPYESPHYTMGEKDSPHEKQI